MGLMESLSRLNGGPLRILLPKSCRTGTWQILAVPKPLK